MKTRPWNIEGECTTYWDPSSTGEEYSQEIRSIKQTLKNPAGMRVEDVLKLMAQGLAQVMDVIDFMDALDNTQNPLEKEPATIKDRLKDLPGIEGEIKLMYEPSVPKTVNDPVVAVQKIYIFTDGMYRECTPDELVKYQGKLLGKIKEIK